MSKARGLRRAITALALCGALAGPGLAQTTEETLADIRQELTVLFVEIQRLNRELSTTGPAQVQVAGSVIDRVNAIESELTRLTALAEALEYRISSVVDDGTNRIGDLEFRLCELEADCDIASLGDTPRLGGGIVPEDTPSGSIAPPPPQPSGGGVQLALSEQDDFDTARELLEAGEHQASAEAFAAFTATYPAGPLSGEAHFFRGEALSAMGQTSAAARAYLESFSGTPGGPRAADALHKLGVSLGTLGQVREACVTLSEVGARFPQAPAAAEARAAMASLNCG